MIDALLVLRPVAKPKATLFSVAENAVTTLFVVLRADQHRPESRFWG